MKIVKKTAIIITTTIFLLVLIFWLGNFHFSKHYLIGRDIPFEKIGTLDVDNWKEAGGRGITGCILVNSLWQRSLVLFIVVLSTTN